MIPTMTSPANMVFSSSDSNFSAHRETVLLTIENPFMQ
jgi:hypothetical protein